MGWGDTIVVGIIVVGALFFLYKGLKEPIDQLFGFIKKLISSMRDKAGDAMEEKQEYIRYS